jgi:glycerol-3-phosphate dehydrogenase (NAD(P)+)
VALHTITLIGLCILRKSTVNDVCILGKGTWGLALANLLRQGKRVQMWSRDASLADAIAGSTFIFSALPMQALRPVALQIQALGLPPDVIIVSTTKGLELDTFLSPREIWQLYLPQNPLAVLSGPNLASEILRGLPCATVVASTQPKVVQQIQMLISSTSFRVYGSTDVRGVELGGALKNVIAISAGVSDGLALGMNARAALITRGLAEILRIGQLLGAQGRTFYGLSGLGDLQTTCTSMLSRNYQVGWHLAQGKPLTTILQEIVGTPEGVNTARVLVQLAQQRHLELPIAQQVTLLLDGKTTPQAALLALMGREPKEGED